MDGAPTWSNVSLSDVAASHVRRQAPAVAAADRSEGGTTWMEVPACLQH
jgi:hypothetical protein